ncbi:ATP-binding protein [Actinoplanes sp. NPDC026619]|uniref:sensor histidine kinase n=1 Tax=Actinoplanes sp. NPDC026619 TaxID=3155798 RepID=UPI00340209FD
MNPPLSRRRRIAGFVLAAGGLPLLTAVTGEISLYLAAVVGVALVGGLWPALPAAVGAFLLLNYFYVAPLHTLAVATGGGLLSLAAFVVVAAAVSWVVDLAARRTAQADTLAEVAGGVLRGGADPLSALLRQLRDTFALDSVTLLERVPAGAAARELLGGVPDGWSSVATVGEPIAVTPADGDACVADEYLVLVLRGRPLSASDRRLVDAFAAQAAVALRQQRLAVAAEGDKMRTALLAAVSHDLRGPLASAKASVAGLRSDDVSFSPDDRAELLATADESLDRLAVLVANLLDMSRLQAGALGVTLADVGLEDVVPAALDELGPPARSITVQLPDDLPAVRVDPGLLDRVLVNIIGNALRFSPPTITGTARGDTVELHVIDHGPGIPPSQWDAVFQPFQRLGDRDNHTGVGLGLALSRGLAEAMGGTLRPAETPGGGLTMILTLPASGSHT